MKESSPQTTQRQQKRELLAWAFLPMMMGAVDGGVIGIMTKRLFDGHVQDLLLDWSVATLAAAQGFANISSFLWASMSTGRHKIRFITFLKFAIVLMIATVAFIPQTTAGLFLLLACVVGTRVCYTGIVTLRSTVWQANYPREKRAAVAGKIATVQALVFASVAFGIGELMDLDDQSFRWLYPVAASFGIIGAWIYSKIEVVNHVELLRDERAVTSNVSFLPWQTFKLLREDVAFAKYMSCQFVLGIGNLMLMAPLIIILNDYFSLDYLGEIFVVTIIPILMVPICTPFWAKLLNKVHILVFRSFHSWFFVISSICIGLSIATHSLSGLWVGAAIRGIAIGGGVLAWSLGHQDYAPVEQSSRYMGLHVTLTGIRGLIAPVVGVGIYTWLISKGIDAGPIVFYIGAALTAVSGIGFVFLAKTRVTSKK